MKGGNSLTRGNKFRKIMHSPVKIKLSYLDYNPKNRTNSCELKPNLLWNFKKMGNRSIVFKKLYFACDYQYLFILLRPKRKINEGRRTTGKA